MESSSPEGLKVPPADVALGDMVSGGLGSAGLTIGLTDLTRPFQPNSYMILNLDLFGVPQLIRIMLF